MTTTHPFRLLRFEQFESRLCLATTVGLGSNGDLQVSGDTAGPIEIIALDADSYNVTENGAPLATVNGVTRAIRLELGSSNDDVTLDLAGQTVNKDVLVNLGGGNNTFTVKHGTIGGHL